ncbi:MAG: pyridoxamine 5'-phosphate oxidase family protein [Synergistaceae bacterium]|jgi:uncharacterized pyridoxamine 5'-phosphate oxidase family protein|nr:pyridoxamine 5'-phosphate oxidase family protein [Synergistaceae bacterium]
MDGKKEFEKIMGKAERIALASAVDRIPNVRIVNFVYSASEKVLYFASTKGDPKESEFSKNHNAAFSTIPARGLAHVRVHYATAAKSGKTVFDAADMFIAKMPWYKENIEQNGNGMDLYEVRFTAATVLAGPERAFQVEL